MIDANTLMKAAKERTGLSDWGDDWYLEPMHRLVDAINTGSERSAQKRNTTLVSWTLVSMV